MKLMGDDLYEYAIETYSLFTSDLHVTMKSNNKSNNEKNKKYENIVTKILISQLQNCTFRVSLGYLLKLWNNSSLYGEF